MSWRSLFDAAPFYFIEVSLLLGAFFILFFVGAIVAACV